MSPNAGSVAWSNLNGNLQITQFTGIALHPTNPDIAYGGSQDNGTEKFTGCLDVRLDGRCRGGDPWGTLSFSFDYWALFDERGEIRAGPPFFSRRQRNVSHQA